MKKIVVVIDLMRILWVSDKFYFGSFELVWLVFVSEQIFLLCKELMKYFMLEIPAAPCLS